MVDSLAAAKPVVLLNPETGRIQSFFLRDASLLNCD
jgi:hypothetical protein